MPRPINKVLDVELDLVSESKGKLLFIQEMMNWLRTQPEEMLKAVVYDYLIEETRNETNKHPETSNE